jgi:hypothetical protein
MDARLWFPPPQPIYLNISTTRFYNDLVVRQPNGEALAITKHATQGDVSFDPSGNAWQNSYFYCDCTAAFHPEMPFYVEDRTTGERIGPAPSNSQLIAWYWRPAPTDLYMIWRFSSGVSLAWNANGASLEGSYIIQRKYPSASTWSNIAEIPATSVAYTDTALGASIGCNYRILYSYAGATSAPSNQLFVGTYSSSAGPTGNGGAGTPVGGTPPPGQDGAQDDPDHDGLTNAEEIAMGTDRTKADSDDDGLTDDKDGWPMAKFLKKPRLPVWRYAVVEVVNGNNLNPVALNNNGDIIYTDNSPLRGYFRAAGQTTSIQIANTHFGDTNPIGSVVGLADNGTVVGTWSRTDPSDNSPHTNFKWQPSSSTIEYTGDTCDIPGHFVENPADGAWSSFGIQGITPGGTVYGAGQAGAWRYPIQSTSINAFAVSGRMVLGYPQPAFVVAKNWIEGPYTDGYANWDGSGNLINNSGDYIFYCDGYTRTENAPIGPSPTRGYYYSRGGAHAELVNCGSGGVALNDDLHILTADSILARTSARTVTNPKWTAYSAPRISHAKPYGSPTWIDFNNRLEAIGSRAKTEGSTTLTDWAVLINDQDYSIQDLVPADWTIKSLVQINEGGMILAKARNSAPTTTADSIVLLLPYDFVVPGKTYQDGADSSADEVGVLQLPISNPRPTVEMSEPQVSMDESAGTLIISIATGAVRDAIADSIDDGGEIQTVGLFDMNEQEDSQLSQASLSEQSDGQATRWRQHPKRFAFSNLSATIPLEAGFHVFEVRTSDNFVGNIGVAGFVVHVWKENDSSDPTAIRWEYGIEVQTPSARGCYVPIGFRMARLGQSNTGCKLSVDGEEFDLEARSDGMWRIKGGSEGFLSIVPVTQADGTVAYDLQGMNASHEVVRHRLEFDANGALRPIPLRLNAPQAGGGVNVFDLGFVPILLPRVNLPVGGTTLATKLTPRVGQPDQQNHFHLNNVAWIEPHSGPNGMPQMPRFEAQLSLGQPPAGQPNPDANSEVRWRLEVDFERPFNGSNPASGHRMVPPRFDRDRVLIPGDRQNVDGRPSYGGWIPARWRAAGQEANDAEAWTAWMPLSQAWDVTAEASWAREVAWGLFGGEARIYWQTRRNGQVGASQFLEFRIGGKNPDDATCKAYIQAHDTDTAGFKHWYAYAIAKHETFGKNVRSARRANPGNIYGVPQDPSLGLFYNQFWEGRPGGYGGAGSPVHNDDGITGTVLDQNGDGVPDGTGGFGLFQLTREQREATFRMPRDWFWNWQANVAAGVDELRMKRASALRCFNNENNSPNLDLRAPANATYVRHAVPRVRNPDNEADPMNSIAQSGWIYDADVGGSDGPAPNGFGPFTEQRPDYRKASFSDRDGYLILDTIRRYNGGRYVYYQTQNSRWAFRRWRTYDRKSYVDLVFEGIENTDVPLIYRP